MRSSPIEIQGYVCLRCRFSNGYESTAGEGKCAFRPPVRGHYRLKSHIINGSAFCEVPSFQ
jgi:hypothetical protein